MQSHRAEWFAAGHVPGGDRVWIRVLHYAGTIQERWQVTAYRARVAHATDRGPVEHVQHRLLLHDPTPAEALAAAAVLGIAPAGV